MGQFVPRAFEGILERMINRVVARTNLDDINDGSELKQVLAAAAREDDDAYYQMVNLRDLFDIYKAIGNDLVERAKEYNPALIGKIEAVAATGQVTFSRTGTTGTVTIAIGTQVSVPATAAAAAITFTTTTEGTISAGNTDSNAVSIVCDEAGTIGNVSPGTIIGFISKPSGVDSVSNTNGLTNGVDLESDDAFRQRLKNLILGLARAHIDGLESAALGTTDSTTGKTVLFAHVIEDTVNLGNVTLYIDDGGGTAGDDYSSVTDKSVLASAVGGETVIFLPDKPIKTSASFTLKRNTIALTEDTDYTLNPASGQINFLPANFPNGLTAADAITYTGTYFEGLIAETQKVIDGDAGDRSNYPGYRAAGVLVRVLSPSVIYPTIAANITVETGFDQTAIAAKVVDALSSYINGLGIGGDVILNELRERAMAIPGMYDVTFTTPTENTVIADSQIARLTSGNITIS